MIPAVDRLRRTFAIVGLAALLVVGAAAASRPCGRAVIDDWYDNGRIDRSWGCACLLDGLTMLPEVHRSGYDSMRNELERQVRAQCARWRVPVNQSEANASGSESELNVSGFETPAAEFETRLEATPTEFDATDTDTDTGEIYAVPWEIVVAGIVSGGLVVLIGAAVLRQWRLRP
jgi:hypothetical protein